MYYYHYYYCYYYYYYYYHTLYQARDLGQLGTADADALEISARALFSADELREKAQVAMQRRIDLGIWDDVEAAQSYKVPEFNQELVGKKLEVLWKYIDQDSKQSQLIWAGGRVVRVADGLTDKRSRNAQKILPGGALLWAWEADPERGEKAGEQWLILLPKKYRKQQHYSWRFAPAEVPDVPLEPEADAYRRRC